MNFRSNKIKILLVGTLIVLSIFMQTKPANAGFLSGAALSAIPVIGPALSAASVGTSLASAATGQKASSPDDMLASWSINAVNWVLSNIVTSVMWVLSWFVVLTGTVLNVAMYLTTHLGIFINHTPVIYSVWKTIRDLCSMILIFVLLYQGILMIVGKEQANFGTIIKNVIIMGVLINFSFFLTRVMIDASNVVSLQFYNAMAPSNLSVSDSQINDIGSLVKTLIVQSKDGGISGIMKGYTNVVQWWQKPTFKDSTADALQQSINIILWGAGGSVVIVITALTLIAAAAAAILRTVMLVFLIAFSPIWIASQALPKLKPLSDKWWAPFKGQLVFLPVYLGFLYVAFRVIQGSNLAIIATGGNTSSSDNMISLFVSFAIVVTVLNMPMLAAVAITGSVGGDTKMTEKWANSVRAWTQRNTVSFAGRNTLGRGASALRNSGVMKSITSKSPALGLALNGGLSKVSSATFGGEKKDSYDDRVKARAKALEKGYEDLGKFDRSNYATKEEADAAQKRFSEMQTQYAANIGNTFGFKRGGMIASLITGRAGRQTAYGLMVGEEADKRYKQIEEKMSKLNRISDNAEWEALEKERLALKPLVDKNKSKKEKDEIIERLSKEVGEKNKDAGGGEKPKEEKKPEGGDKK